MRRSEGQRGWVCLLALALGLAPGVNAQPRAGLPLPGAAPPAEAGGAADRVETAVKRGVDFLVSCQNPATGAIVEGRRAVGGFENAMTSLAIMALAAVGHQPTDATEAGRAMKSALAFMLREDRQGRGDERWAPVGYFGRADNSRMYGHGIATLMLAEMLGMGADPQQDDLIRDRLQKAVDLILQAQKAPKMAGFQGGWRYLPDARDSDMSVTVWQVMALRAAKNAGIEVPKAAIDDAVAYIKRSYAAPGRMAADGSLPAAGFGYVLTMDVKYSTTAAGLLALQVCGDYDAPQVKGATEWLSQERNLPRGPGGTWFLYGTYYYAQGMYQRGEPYASTARQNVERWLLPAQAGDGSWRSAEGGTDRVYSTSLAILSLSVRYHYLPIYQR